MSVTVGFPLRGCRGGQENSTQPSGTARWLHRAGLCPGELLCSPSTFPCMPPSWVRNII